MTQQMTKLMKRDIVDDCCMICCYSRTPPLNGYVYEAHTTISVAAVTSAHINMYIVCCGDRILNSRRHTSNRRHPSFIIWCTGIVVNKQSSHNSQQSLTNDIVLVSEYRRQHGGFSSKMYIVIVTFVSNLSCFISQQLPSLFLSIVPV